MNAVLNNDAPKIDPKGIS
jgi:hypothetical protein